MNPAWMPLYIADYRADTTHLGAAEHGAYLLLLMHYWQTGGLPDDDKLLSRIACMTPREWKAARPVVAPFFQAGWKHKRVDAELAHARDVIAKRKAAVGQRRKNPPRYDGPEDGSNDPSNDPSNEATNDARDDGSEDAHSCALQPPPPVQAPEQTTKVVDFNSGSFVRLVEPGPSVELFSEPELAHMALTFDLVEVREVIPELGEWCDGKGIAKPNERKSAIYGALEKRQMKFAAARTLTEARAALQTGPPPTADVIGLPADGESPAVAAFRQRVANRRGR